MLKKIAGKVYIFNSSRIEEETKNEKYVGTIPIGRAVRASCSYPLVFSPCEYKNKVFLDGGIKENIPWRELKRIGCDKVFSIGFSSNQKKKCCANVIEIAERTLELMNEELNKYELDKIDFLHTIELSNISLLQMEKMEEIYKQGYIQTKNNMKAIKNYLNSY